MMERYMTEAVYRAAGRCAERISFGGYAVRRHGTAEGRAFGASAFGRICRFVVLAVSVAAMSAGCGGRGRISVEWDRATERFVTSGVYARIAALDDGRFALVYSAGPAVWLRMSDDGCDTWSEAVKVAESPEYDYTNSELVQLDNGWLLYTWNARPHTSGVSPYRIMGALSDDGGRTWRIRAIYTAGCESGIGCWEPVALQLPDGEVQLYFANEAPYASSDEQEITMMRSHDRGVTWEEPERVSFRAGSRDGMPVPVYLPRSGGIAVAIEDNGMAGRFKPVVVRSGENWRDGYVSGDSPRRTAALVGAERLHDTVYAGAPYLIRLKRGGTLLSVQSAEGRSGDNERYAVMRVYAGDDEACGFCGRTEPFPDLPPSANALWNSLCEIDDSTVVAVSSVHGAGRDGIWTVKGRVMRE